MIRFLDISQSHREKDENGFLIIKENPIAKAGVFEYLKSEILPDFKGEDTLVKVYRPFDALVKAKENFANKPIKLSHLWVGDEAKQADGAIASEIREDAENGYLIADLIIYNPDLIAKIESGEIVELSPAYTGEIQQQAGRFNGEDYEFTQSVECVNHLAVVENGRSGSDLRILDEKPIRKDTAMNLKKFKDELAKFIAQFKDEDAQEQEQKVEDSDKAAQILAICKGEGEDADKIAKINELLSTADEECQAQDENSEGEKEVEDSEGEPTQDSDTAEPTQDEDSEGENVEAKIAELVNEAIDKKLGAFQDALNANAKRIQDSYSAVSKALGAHFDYTGKSEAEIYQIGYEALSGQKLAEGVDAKSAFSVVSAMKTPKFSDSKPQDTASDSKILQMLAKL